MLSLYLLLSAHALFYLPLSPHTFSLGPILLCHVLACPLQFYPSAVSLSFFVTFSFALSISSLTTCFFSRSVCSYHITIIRLLISSFSILIPFSSFHVLSYSHVQSCICLPSSLSPSRVRLLCLSGSVTACDE